MRKIILFTLIGLAAVAVAAVGWRAFGSPAGRGPVSLTVDCGSQGTDYELCRERVEVFELQTGYRVEVKQSPFDASLHLALLEELSATRSQGVDVYRVDVIWPGILADDLVDLSKHFSEEELADFFPGMLENNTVDGRLVALPYFTDAGLLYYRTDLLEKYGFDGPPQTWAELEQMARTIQEGERAAGNPDFWGYAWQGRQAESLTCDALEWLVSEGAGSVVEPDGEISIGNEKAVAALDRAAGWIGTISPEDTPKFDEEASRILWETGDVAFMRNWPYAYSLGNAEGSAVAGLFDVTTLPRGEAGTAATLGGWQLAVSRHSRFPREAAELVRFLTGAETQRYRAINGAFNPTRQSLYRDPAVLAANPFFERMPEVLMAAAPRPSTVTGARYAEVSAAFHTSVHRVLTGELTGAQATSQLAGQLEGIRGSGW